MNTELPKTVYSELVSDLLPGLLAIVRAMKPDGHGGYRGTFTLGPDEWTPVRRALMRVEADLLREEADSIGLPGSENPERTHDQRAADALVRLAQAVGGSAPGWT